MEERLKILLVTQYYYPESFIINDFVNEIVTRGHSVVVYTGKPNYPDGQVFHGYRASGFTVEVNNNLKICRVPLTPRGSGGALALSLNYLSFLKNGLLYLNQIEEDRFDVILSFGLSPITSTIPAIFAKRRFGSPVFLWLQDLWPESLVATGYIKNKYILIAVSKLVKWIYDRCDLILAQSKDFMLRVQSISKTKTVYFPNSFKKDAGNGFLIPQDVCEQLKGKFVVLFAGNLGRAQSLETVVEAADALLEKKDIVFVFVGDGSLKSWLREEVKVKGLTNIILLGRFPMEAMASFYAMADILLVSLRNDPVVNSTIPSKIQSYMSSGKPIVGVLNGAGADIINESGCGLVSEADCSAGLVESVIHMYKIGSEGRYIFGQSGLAFFENNFEMSRKVDDLLTLISTHNTERRK
jgi:glycosyltransferase involved in cell wall biosynthesis